MVFAVVTRRRRMSLGRPTAHRGLQDRSSATAGLGRHTEPPPKKEASPKR